MPLSKALNPPCVLPGRWHSSPLLLACVYVCVYLECAASDGLNAEDTFQVWLHVWQTKILLLLLLLLLLLHYQQCNVTSEWHHQRQFIRLHAASSGATKDFIILFHICSRTQSPFMLNQYVITYHSTHRDTFSQKPACLNVFLTLIGWIRPPSPDPFKTSAHPALNKLAYSSCYMPFHSQDFPPPALQIYNVNPGGLPLNACWALCNNTDLLLLLFYKL